MRLVAHAIRQGAHAAVAAALLCASLLGEPAVAADGYLATDLREADARLERSITSLSDSARAVLKAQTTETIGGYASSIVDIALNAEPAELAKLVSIGLDTALSVPPDSSAALTRNVKEAFTGLSPDSCDLVPLPTGAIERILGSNALSGADPAKRKLVNEQWAPIWKSVPRREASVCLPSSSALEKAAQAQAGAAKAADPARLRALGEQAQVTVKSVKKGSSFKIFSEVGKQQLAVLGRASLQERDRFKRDSAEFVQAARFVDELRIKKAEGAPKCFTIGCQTNFEYDLWRYNSKDDYTGEGLDKGYSILKPDLAGLTKVRGSTESGP